MHNDEVIITRLRSGVLSSGKFAWLREDALDCTNVLLSFILGQVAAIEVIRVSASKQNT